MQDKLIKLSKFLELSGYLKESEYLKSILTESNLTKSADSTGNIVSILGIPKPIAKAIQDRFGSISFAIASWMKDYYSWRPGRWWDDLGSFSKPTMGDYLKFFEATTKPMEEYLVWLKKNGYSSNRTTTPEEDRNLIQSEIADMLFKDPFFKTTLISAVMNTNFDIRPYKKLNFDEALNSFNIKKLGDPNSIIEEYEDGWRWVDAGAKCELVGSELGNCGSVGVMSDDPGRTMLVLLNTQLTPKVVATYSPNQKRISQVQGAGSTEPDSAYFDYILSLSKKLNAPLLEKSLDRRNFKIWLYVATESKPEIFNAGYFNNIYKFTMPDGRVWYSDSNYFIEESNLLKAADILTQDQEVQKNIQALREMDNLPENMDKYHSVLAFGDAYDHVLKGKMPEDWKLGQGRFEDLYQIPKIQRF